MARCACCIQDFVTSLSVIARGSIAEKLRWTFRLYDVNGDGVISRRDMTTIVSSIYGLMGRYASPAVTSRSIQQHVDAIFEACRSRRLIVVISINQSINQSRFFKVA